jgi:uncharacterized protein (TIGR02001 family)
MKKLLLVAAVAATITSAPSFAADVTPDNVVAYNVGVVTDYRYRGISQTRLKPAVQGGVDYTNNPTGLYAGAWASTIKWTKDTAELDADGNTTGKFGDGSIELDIYGGKRGEIVPGVTYDVGVLTYVYPGNKFDKLSGFKNANTTEVYGQVGYSIFTAKYSSSVTNLFGNVNSKNSGYLDLSANVDLTEGYTMGLHFGRQTVKNGDIYTYNDWKVGVTKEFFGVAFGANVYGTSAKETSYTTVAEKGSKFNGKTGLVVSAVKYF